MATLNCLSTLFFDVVTHYLQIELPKDLLLTLHTAHSSERKVKSRITLLYAHTESIKFNRFDDVVFSRSFHINK